MQTIKVDREFLNNLIELDKARKEKSQAEKTEKTVKARLTLPTVETAFMFDGKVVGTLTGSYREGVDLEKLQKEFQKAWQACQKKTPVLTLRVTI